MVRCRLIGAVALLVVTGVMVPTSSALEPPTKEQIERYRRDGTLAERAVAARKLDNHRVAPELARRLVGRAEAVKNREISKVLPSTGNRRVFALLIDFEDHTGQNRRSDFDRRLFGSGLTSEHPYESLREYYQRSSYGQLDIEGTTFAWYTYPNSRDRIEETTAGREGLIQLCTFPEPGQTPAQVLRQPQPHAWPSSQDCRPGQYRYHARPCWLRS